MSTRVTCRMRLLTGTLWGVFRLVFFFGYRLPFTGNMIDASRRSESPPTDFPAAARHRGLRVTVGCASPLLRVTAA